MDLDHDGLTNKDLKKELQLLFLTDYKRQQQHHLELLEFKGKYWLCRLGIPGDDYNRIHEDFNVRFKFYLGNTINFLTKTEKLYPLKSRSHIYNL